MQYVVVIMGKLEHGHRERHAVGPLQYQERAIQVRDEAIEAGLEAFMLMLGSSSSAEGVIESMAADLEWVKQSHSW